MISGFHSEEPGAKKKRSGSGTGKPGCNSVQYTGRINADRWRASRTAEPTTMRRKRHATVSNDCRARF